MDEDEAREVNLNLKISDTHFTLSWLGATSRPNDKENFG